MNRRLRFALLLAALAAGAPSAAPHVFDATRLSVSIAWLRAEPATRSERRQIAPAIRVAVVARVAVSDHYRVDPADPLRLHSLFQRPPPLRS